MNTLVALFVFAAATASAQNWKVTEINGNGGTITSNGIVVKTLAKNDRYFVRSDGSIVPDGSAYMVVAGNPLSQTFYSLTEKGWSNNAPKKAVWPTTAPGYNMWSNDSTLINLAQGSAVSPAAGAPLYLVAFAAADISRIRPGEVGIFTSPTWKVPAKGGSVDIKFTEPTITAVKGSVNTVMLKLAAPIPTPVKDADKPHLLFGLYPPGFGGTGPNVRTMGVYIQNFQQFSGYQIQKSTDLRNWTLVRRVFSSTDAQFTTETSTEKKLFYRLEYTP